MDEYTSLQSSSISRRLHPNIFHNIILPWASLAQEFRKSLFSKSIHRTRSFLRLLQFSPTHSETLIYFCSYSKLLKARNHQTNSAFTLALSLSLSRGIKLKSIFDYCFNFKPSHYSFFHFQVTVDDNDDVFQFWTRSFRILVGWSLPLQSKPGHAVYAT